MAERNGSGAGEGRTPAVDPLAAIAAAYASLTLRAQRIGPSRVAWAALALASAAAAFLILDWGPSQSFVNDEWNYFVVLYDWRLETLMAPENGHLIVAPLLLYKLMFATVGGGSHVPYQIVTIALHLTVALLFFLLARRRVDLVVAVALTLLVIFLGAGWDTIMGAYEVPNLMGMAGGLGMLLAIERRSLLGDISAFLLLCLSLASFSVGLAFAIGAFVSIWLGGKPEWRRFWIPLIPFLLWLGWFVWARKFHQSTASWEGFTALFSGIMDQLAAITAAITGLFRVPGSNELTVLISIRSEWGYPLALLLIGGIVVYAMHGRRSIWFWTVVATLLSYAALVSVGLSPARGPSASRYVYIGAILTLLLLVELLRRVRWTTALGMLATLVLALSLISNAAELKVGGRLFAAEGETNRSTLGALELVRDIGNPDLTVEDGATTTHSHADMLFPVWAYYRADDDFGGPGMSPREISEAGLQAREAADQQLVRNLELKPEEAPRSALARSGKPIEMTSAEGKTAQAGTCVQLLPAGGQDAVLDVVVPPGGFGYRTTANAAPTVTLFRFTRGEGAGDELPAVAGTAVVRIPRDPADDPWLAKVGAEAPTLLCPLRDR